MGTLRSLLLLPCLLLAVLPATADDAEDPNARDLLILSEWFEGEFDNEEQLWFHRRSRAEGEPPVRIHMVNHRVSLPDFGEHVFYTEEYRDNDPQQVYRQRLVVFTSVPEKRAIRMQQGFFKEPAAVLGAQASPERLANLDAEDVVFLDDCDVWVRRMADQFQGAMMDRACVFGEGDLERYSVHEIVLSANKLWRKDATYLVADDSYHRGTPPGEMTELRRATTFICDFYFDGLDGGEAQESKGHRVFSQGGSATAVREADGQSFDVLLREKEYPYYETRPDFIYYSLRYSGELRSFTYGVADPQSRQFGAKSHGVGLFCHREGYEFQETVETLP